MKFTIRQNNLKDALASVQGVIERKATIPVLANVLIESVGETAIRLTATDLDVTIRRTVEADIHQAGTMCIAAGKLFDISRQLPSGDVVMEKDANEWAVLKCGRSKFRLAGVSREQYPESPTQKSTPIKLDLATLREMLRFTVIAVTNEVSKFSLQGCKLEIETNTARMISTDGHRCAFVERDLPGGGTASVLLPKKAISEIVKIAEDSEVSIGADDKHFFLETADRLLATRLLAGSFPNYEMILPKDNDQSFTVSAGDLKDGIRRVSMMADERNRSIRLHVSSGEIRIAAASGEEGEAEEIVACEYAGEDLTFSFQWMYISEFLGTVEDSAKVRIEFKAPTQATDWRVVGDEGLRYVLMPLRIT